MSTNSPALSSPIASPLTVTREDCGRATHTRAPSTIGDESLSSASTSRSSSPVRGYAGTPLAQAQVGLRTLPPEEAARFAAARAAARSQTKVLSGRYDSVNNHVILEVEKNGSKETLYFEVTSLKVTEEDGDAPIQLVGARTNTAMQRVLGTIIKSFQSLDDVSQLTAQTPSSGARTQAVSHVVNFSSQVAAALPTPGSAPSTTYSIGFDTTYHLSNQTDSYEYETTSNIKNPQVMQKLLEASNWTDMIQGADGADADHSFKFLSPRRQKNAGLVTKLSKELFSVSERGSSLYENLENALQATPSPKLIKLFNFINSHNLQEQYNAPGDADFGVSLSEDWHDQLGELGLFELKTPGGSTPPIKDQIWNKIIKLDVPAPRTEQPQRAGERPVSTSTVGSVASYDDPRARSPHFGGSPPHLTETPTHQPPFRHDPTIAVGPDGRAVGTTSAPLLDDRGQPVTFMPGRDDATNVVTPTVTRASATHLDPDEAALTAEWDRSVGGTPPPRPLSRRAPTTGRGSAFQPAASRAATSTTQRTTPPTDITIDGHVVTAGEFQARFPALTQQRSGNISDFSGMTEDAIREFEREAQADLARRGVDQPLTSTTLSRPSTAISRGPLRSRATSTLEQRAARQRQRAARNSTPQTRLRRPATPDQLTGHHFGAFGPARQRVATTPVQPVVDPRQPRSTAAKGPAQQLPLPRSHPEPTPAQRRVLRPAAASTTPTTVPPRQAVNSAAQPTVVPQPAARPVTTARTTTSHATGQGVTTPPPPVDPRTTTANPAQPTQRAKPKKQSFFGRIFRGNKSTKATRKRSPQRPQPASITTTPAVDQHPGRTRAQNALALAAQVRARHNQVAAS